MKTNAEAAMEELLERGIKPHAEALARLAADGQVGCVVWKPEPVAESAARLLGWQPQQGDVFALSQDACAHLAIGDRVTARWLAAGSSIDGTVRAFVISGHGSLLVNFKPGRGWWIEPGSLETDEAFPRA